MSAALSITTVDQGSVGLPANDAAPTARSLLRFITCGSVDDGKSTLIGRLLVEAGAVPEDVLATMRTDSARIGNAGDALDYSLLVDGLSAEREQGITIDVAYRYFATAKRAFIVADTPGHEQYTRNMATGASGADLAVILIDARKGVLPQTRRHALIASLVGVRHVIVAINKIDLVGYHEAVFRTIEADFRDAVGSLRFETITAIPVSAREGDNVAVRSPRTPWHDGPTLLGWLENAITGATAASTGFIMPVQRVNRPDLDFRGFQGMVSAGLVRPGQEIVALPSGAKAVVTRIVTFDGDLAEAREGQAVTLVFDRELDISRGDILVSGVDTAIAVQNEAVVRLLTTADRPIEAGASFSARIGPATANVRITEIIHGVGIDDFGRHETNALAQNELGLVRLAFDRPIVAAPYAVCRDLGALILIDPLTNATAAMGVVIEQANTGQGGPSRDSVINFRSAADRTLTTALGVDWRRDIAPATSWRLASAMLLGLVIAMLTGNPVLGLAAAMLDAVLRPALHFAHHGLWRRLRARRLALSGQQGDGI